ncbi:MFS transporter [Leucobacter allii]|uniref:MFS transporter n=2 Tax=Leucobacter allii TaxID=2932247 RepID=A0ABY4FRB3_9MICO|nr:MFS transporter [Leucobacter allii]UOQ58826.1 MFS transporter [Leucobacter allii]
MAPSIYGPTMLFTLGEYAMLPLIPVIATGMGAGIGLSGLIASAAVVGQLAGNLPASWVVARAGERIAMLAASAVALLGAAGVALAPHLALLGASVFLVGFAAATFGLARHAFMTTRVPVAFRARSLALIGGAHRLGRFAGPFLAAGLLAATGDQSLPVWAFVGCLALTAALVGFAPDPERSALAGSAPGAAPGAVPAAGGGAAGSGARPGPDAASGGIRSAVRAGGGGLLRVGGASAILAGLRAVKDVLLPLWGVSIGMDPAAVALVVGVSGTIDFALFYASGQVMDRFGRLWAALPATVAMALSFLVLSVTHDAPGAEIWLIACGAAMGLGNGLSSGINLTLGADLAPPGNPAPYLAAWRTLTDFGGAAAPLAASAIAVVSLPAAAAATGVLAVLGAAAFARWVPRYVPRAPTRRRGGAV